MRKRVYRMGFLEGKSGRKRSDLLKSNVEKRGSFLSVCEQQIGQKNHIVTCQKTGNNVLLWGS